MEAGTALVGRKMLAVFVAVMLMASVMLLFADSPARAGHIPETGDVPDNCLKFEGAGVLGTEGLSDSIGDVDITFTNWVEKPGESGEYTSVDITVSGLEPGQHLDWQLKTGAGVDEGSISADGTVTASVSEQQAISHITVCLFTDPPPPTTTSTTVPETTTTVPETTTTTIEDEVLPTVITTSTTLATTTTVEDEVLDTEVLPFTGNDNDMLALLAGGLGLLGTLVLASTRRMEDN